MIEAILPGEVRVAELRAEDGSGFRFAEEEALVERAVGKRRQEFAAGRECAHRALEALGVAAGPIMAGERGEPLWPAGVVGTITHTRGYRGAAVARDGEFAALGIDAEPHEPLPPRLVDSVARPEEREALAALARAEPGVHWDRLLFSAKESVFKAWFPLSGQRLGLEDTHLELDPAGRRFEAQLVVPAEVDGAPPRSFGGRWAVGEGLVLTAVALRRT